MNDERWLQLMNKLGLGDNQDTFSKLTTAYSEHHRNYHDTSHITSSLQLLDDVSSLADEPAEIELALWFHDAVYKPLSSSNELDSANWAVAFLLKNHADDEVKDRVHNLIMATCHRKLVENRDQALLVDIDLSILGTKAEVYDNYERNIRKEYKLIPSFIYKKKRKEILNSFLAKEHIYMNSYFRERYEQQARNNLRKAILQL